MNLYPNSPQNPLSKPLKSGKYEPQVAGFLDERIVFGPI